MTPTHTAVLVLAGTAVIGYAAINTMVTLLIGRTRPLNGYHRIDRIIDGDTIRLQGIPTAIRLAGIDAPEHTTTRFGHTEALGTTATRWLRHRLPPGTRVRIETEPGTDKWQRHLAYVWKRHHLINATIVAAGLATTTRPRRHRARFKQAQSTARLRRRGLWRFRHRRHRLRKKTKK